MKSILLAGAFFSLACLLPANPVAHAQGTGTSAEIRGTVTDATGATVPKATVAVEDTEKGVRRTSTTESDGGYRLTGLPPSSYSVTVQIAGFQTETQKGVVINIGQTLILDFHLQVATATMHVEVSAELPVVETARGSQADTLVQQFIADLPINRRDYLTFTLLSPGVSDSTRMSGNQDFRVKQTPQSGLSFYGSNGRGNSVTVDGGEANDDAGGVRLNLGQDAVQEFQINRSNYGADLGGASGASINIVSKSGGNQAHGSLFGFFRNDALDARNPFAISQALQPGDAFNPANPDAQGQPIKDSLSRQQFGGSVGFPVTKDKTFVFAAFEGLRQDAQNAVPLLTNTKIFRPDNGTSFIVNGQPVGNNQAAIIAGLAAKGATLVPCLRGGTVILPASTCAAALGGLLTINPGATPSPFLSAGQIARYAYIVNQFESNGGVLPFNTRQYLASGRLDHYFNDNNQAFLRYSYGHDREENPDVQALVGSSAGSAVKFYDNTLQASWFHQLSQRTQNEARVQWNYYSFNVIPNAPGQVGLSIPGFASLGTNIFLPSRSIERRYEFADNITFNRGAHTLKAGGYELLRGNHTESHTFFPGRFVFGSLPGGLLSPCLVASSTATTQNPCGLLTSGAAINSLQSVGLGLPQFYQQGFGDPIDSNTRPLTAFYVQDSWAVRPNFTFNFGVRYELDTQYGTLNTDKDNFGPRVSFAWDPFKDHKTVIRGGYGIFYASIYYQIPNVVKTLGIVGTDFRQIAQVFVSIRSAAPNSAAIFQTLFAQGKVQCTTPAAGNYACITPADLTQFGINITHTGPIPPLSVIFSGQKDSSGNPNFRNPYAQQAELGIERQITNSLSVSLSGIYVHTIGLPVASDINLLPAAPLKTVTLANGQTTSFRNWADPACGANPSPCFVNPSILQSNAYSALASALYEGGILQVKKRFSEHVSLIANYTYSKAFDTSTDFNSDFSPVDQTNLSAERALSDFDQRHKVVVAAVLETGNKGRDAGVARSLFSGFQIAPIFRYNSGHPFNLLAGTDVNGDRHSTNDRPIGAARNTGKGPDLIAFDFRLSRQFKFAEKATLQLTAEGFNLFNRTNFASVNNSVPSTLGLPTAAGGIGFTSFNVTAIPGNSPSQPLGYTAAFARRQIQLGLRLTF